MFNIVALEQAILPLERFEIHGYERESKIYVGTWPMKCGAYTSAVSDLGLDEVSERPFGRIQASAVRANDRRINSSESLQ